MYLDKINLINISPCWRAPRQGTGARSLPSRVPCDHPSASPCPGAGRQGQCPCPCPCPCSWTWSTWWPRAGWCWRGAGHVNRLQESGETWAEDQSTRYILAIDKIPLSTYVIKSARYAGRPLLMKQTHCLSSIKQEAWLWCCHSSSFIKIANCDACLVLLSKYLLSMQKWHFHSLWPEPCTGH